MTHSIKLESIESPINCPIAGSRPAMHTNTLRISQRSVGYVLISMAFVMLAQTANASGPFPSKPIQIIVYTRPGGLIDTTARKFTEIAKKYTDLDVTMVVVNKPGSGGITAIEKVLQLPNDGHTLLACTKSNIAKIVQSNRKEYIDELNWIGMMMADPECIITRSNQSPTTLEELIEDATSKPGEQIWLGPAMGGLDHVTALKVWDSFDVDAKWIPYESGGEAKASLLGGEGVAYVGNPRDAAENDDLHIAVVSGSKRLEQFPDTPTFSDYGVEGLDKEFMWRGFAIRKGCPPEALQWYDELFRAVTSDKDWKRFWEKDGIEVLYYDAVPFTKIVREDHDEFTHYLERLEMIQPTKSADSPKDLVGIAILLAVIAVNTLLVLALVMKGKTNRVGHYLIPSIVLSLAVLCFAAASGFPATDRVGAATIPKLWAVLMIPVALLLAIRASRSADLDDGDSSKPKQTQLTWGFIALVVAYIILTIYAGYFVASFVFLVSAMYLLGLRQPPLSIAVACRLDCVCVRRVHTNVESLAADWLLVRAVPLDQTKAQTRWISSGI